MQPVDLHIHSIASGHAINTVYEILKSARMKRLTHIGITEHGPSMVGAADEGYFWISDQMDRFGAIKVYLGIEANILDERGRIDINGDLLRKQGIVSAGLHAKTPYSGQDLKEHTQATIKAMQNPFIKIITHPYRPEFPIDIDSVVKASLETNTLLEINDSLFSRKENLPELIEAYSRLVEGCKRSGIPVILGSDAHMAHRVGCTENIDTVKEQIGLVDKIIINNNQEMLARFINQKQN